MHVTVPALFEQFAVLLLLLPPSTAETKLIPEGIASVITTLSALSAPLFVTVIV